MANEAQAVAPAAPAAAAPAVAAPAAAVAAAPAAAAPAAAAPVAAPAAAAPAAAAPASAAAAPAAAAAAGAKKAPENYADFTTPEGTIVDKEVATVAKAVMKELDLSQADAQKLIDKMGPALAKSEQTRFTALTTARADAWRAASLKDAEIGGEKHAENMAIAMKTFDAFGTPALREVLNKTGLGDNPELLRWAYRIGKAIGPDNKIVAGTNLANAGVAPEDRLWPDKK